MCRGTLMPQNHIATTIIYTYMKGEKIKNNNEKIKKRKNKKIFNNKQ